MHAARAVGPRLETRQLPVRRRLVGNAECREAGARPADDVRRACLCNATRPAAPKPARRARPAARIRGTGSSRRSPVRCARGSPGSADPPERSSCGTRDSRQAAAPTPSRAPSVSQPRGVAGACTKATVAASRKNSDQKMSTSPTLRRAVATPHATTPSNSSAGRVANHGMRFAVITARTRRGAAPRERAAASARPIRPRRRPARRRR